MTSFVWHKINVVTCCRIKEFGSRANFVCVAANGSLGLSCKLPQSVQSMPVGMVHPVISPWIQDVLAIAVVGQEQLEVL